MKKTSALFLITFLSFGAYNSPAQPKSTTQPNAITMTTAHLEINKSPLTTQEREYAIKLLKETEQAVFNSVKGLSEAQLNFKPAADKWSVAECVKHIAVAEKTLWAMAEEPLKQPANPEKRADIKFTDEELVAAVEDRSHKSKTFSALEPANSPYKSVPEALAAFKQDREKLIDFVKNTQTDLRDHVLALPVGTYDTYQFILLIAAHSNRHTQQIEEVKINADFPKM